MNAMVATILLLMALVMAPLVPDVLFGTILMIPSTTLTTIAIVLLFLLMVTIVVIAVTTMVSKDIIITLILMMAILLGSVTVITALLSLRVLLDGRGLIILDCRRRRM
jgi:hypothetical protein